MIVAGMTPEQIRKEILTDLMMIRNKINYPHLRRELIKSHVKVMCRHLEYQTRTYNKWFIRVVWSKKAFIFEPVVMYFDHQGMSAVSIRFDKGKIYLDMYYTHFFKRYRERMHMESLSHEELFREFFRVNSGMSQLTMNDEESNEKLTFTLFVEGVAFGEKISEEFQFIKTFLPYNMLLPFQLEVVDQMRNSEDGNFTPNPEWEKMVRSHLNKKHRLNEAA